MLSQCRADCFEQAVSPTTRRLRVEALCDFVQQVSQLARMVMEWILVVFCEYRSCRER